MIQKEIVIRNKTGLHARPAAVFVQTAHKFKSAVKIVKEGMEINGKSIISVLTLAAAYNTKLLLIVDGVDEAEAIKALSEILEQEE